VLRCPGHSLIYVMGRGCLTMDWKTELFERGERVAKVGFAAVAFMGAVKGVVVWQHLSSSPGCRLLD